MVRNDAADLLAQRLGNRKDLVHRIYNEMSVVQRSLEDRYPHPWFLEKLTKVTAEAQDDLVAVPSDFIVEAEEGGVVPLVEGKRKPQLIKRDYDELAARFPGEAEIPEAYALISNQLVFFPQFTKTFDFYFLYYGRDQELVSNDENAWLREAPELIISEVGAKMAAMHLQAPQLAETFKRQALVEWDTLMKRHEERKIANVEAYMGGE